MGAGFDCLGVSLGLYNYVCAEETDGGGLTIEIKDSTSKFLPKDERNLVYRAMKILFDRVGYTPKGLRIVLENKIPVTRGLGSSSAGIVGGLVAANEISRAKLSDDELLNIAAEIEGHPDNVAPALLGGLTVNVTEGKKVRYVKVEVPEDIIFATFVPDFILSTKKSRSILPKGVSVRNAVFNMGRTALLISSIIKGKYENIRTAVDDRIHQRYRKKLIPHIDDLFDAAEAEGALGVYLSGAGPAVVAMVRSSDTEFEKNMREFLNKKMNNWQLYMLKPDNEGAAVCCNDMEE